MLPTHALVFNTNSRDRIRIRITIHQQVSPVPPKMPRDHRRDSSANRDDYRIPQWYEERIVNGERVYCETKGPNIPLESPNGSTYSEANYPDYDRRESRRYSNYDHHESPRYSHYGGPGSSRRRHSESRDLGYDRYHEDDFNRYTPRPRTVHTSGNGYGYDSPTAGHVSPESLSPRHQAPPHRSRPQSPPHTSRSRSFWSKIFRPKSPHPPPRRRRATPVGTLHFAPGEVRFPDGAYRLRDGNVYKMKRRSRSKSKGKGRK
jgi:hypothetical protein